MKIKIESEFLPMPHSNYVPIGRIITTINLKALLLTTRIFEMEGK
jgi:hypothetical protein